MPHQLVQLGHAFAMQAYPCGAGERSRPRQALIARAREIADRAGDSDLTIRVRLIENYGVVLNGDDSGRDEILSILNSGPKHIDELYSGGWSNLTYFDVEQRRLDVAAELLDVTIPLMHEHDLPICRVWQIGSRARLQLMVGEWDDAAADADRVLDGPSAPLARTWPLAHPRVGGAAQARRWDETPWTTRGSSRAGSANRSGCCPSRRRSSSFVGRQANPTIGYPNAANC